MPRSTVTSLRATARLFARFNRSKYFLAWYASKDVTSVGPNTATTRRTDSR